MLQYSEEVRDARLNAVDATIGADAILMIRTGAPPADCAAADSGDVLATVNLPTVWMDPASGGVKVKAGTWEDSSADDDGTAAHFRLYAADGTTCHAQGTVTATGGGGDMEVNNVVFATGQIFIVTDFTLTAGNG